MKLYEVVFWGSHGDGNAEDTIYLVRAKDFRGAIEDVRCNASPSDHCGKSDPLPHVVYEIGTDLCQYGQPQILRGPYFAFAYNRGWRAWERKVEGIGYGKVWEEQIFPKITLSEVIAADARTWPTSGIADFDGKPHYYRFHFDDRYHLSPVTKKVAEAAREWLAIFKRWDAMRQATPDFEYDAEGFGSLPEERGRYRELGEFLRASYAATAKTPSFLMRGKFLFCEDFPSELGVKWTEVEPVASDQV